jgi:plasmid stabilization system protein ParE
MSFELDTFTTLQPAHFEIDDDYTRRKTVYDGVKTWAIGQAMAIGRTIDLMTDPARGRDGIFPELVFFDCHACHHPMSNLRWQPRRGTGLKPGIVRLNDSNLVMLRVIARHVDQDIGDALFQDTLALHAASTEGIEATAKAAKALRQAIDKLVGILKSYSFGPADIQALLRGVVEEGLAGEYADYAAAEQATMALGSIVDAMKRSGMIDSGQLEPMIVALEACYKAVEKDEAYKPAEFAEALGLFKAAIPEL